MSKVTLETLDKRLDRLDQQLSNFATSADRRFDGVDKQLHVINGKLSGHDDLLHLIADTVSRHDDDLTHIKRALRHQRV